MVIRRILLDGGGIMQQRFTLEAICTTMAMSWSTMQAEAVVALHAKSMRAC